MKSGRVLFQEIPQLPNEWWNDQDAVWKRWNEQTYYLWGANPRNYSLLAPGERLGGSGMASVDGPTRGRGYSHYIGVITTAHRKHENNMLFNALKEKLLSGADIVIPTFKGRFSLGTGAALHHFSSLKEWYASQRLLFELIIELASQASEVIFSDDSYWPDCGNASVLLPLRDLNDLKKVHRHLEAKQA